MKNQWKGQWKEYDKEDGVFCLQHTMQALRVISYLLTILEVG